MHMTYIDFNDKNKKRINIYDRRGGEGEGGFAAHPIPHLVMR